MTLLQRILMAAGLVALAASNAGSAQAQEQLKLAVGQRGNWDTSVSEIGSRLGIFKKHNLELQLLYTQGGGETQQAVLSNSVDIGIAGGIMGALSAFSKGAPIRIIGAETTGGQDLYWYVKADSPIKTLKDFDGKTVAYSTNGSSTHGVVNAFVQENGLKPRLTATGGPAPTLTQVMSGQIDVGWSAPPFGLEQLNKGEIRVIATGNDTKAFKSQTVRLLITNTAVLQNKKDQIDRFMKAYRETVEAMYSGDEALKVYAEFVGVPLEIAKRTRDEFFPKEALNPDRIFGLETIVNDAVTLKYTAQPLTQAQLDTLIQIPPRR
ncbi:ABC transporter substrate-binding protein [Bosea minatitlanensis]|jgi:NitT/TauT family transport system substrate-binding protein|uniref:ABC transporter substrate-binding protein n=1 Tax=Bosea minatitlanensis TaxID=128782 RepID=A0ABW0F3F8_9HYPH|nr:ABC transporter substrate-binding protein [Bosea minatitlanensis]MCT4493982.1 ABC transporter substrate-binding protein [Bosea minatitlanensis]